MAKNSWCHFIQRVERFPISLHSKFGASLNWENEKFSYIVVQKISQNENTNKNNNEKWNKLIRAPLKRGGHIILDCCSYEGKISRNIITKSKAGKLIYRVARKSFWGDSFQQITTVASKN